MKSIYLFFIVLVWTEVAIGQQTDPPEPCTTGAENTCTCLNSNGTTICWPEVLDGFTYEMTSFQHPQDGPNNPMCIPGGNGTTAHNPTWFAFIAWCPTLSLRVNFSGCTDMQPGPGVCAGLQAAVFSDCNNIPGSTVPGGCNTAGGCNATSGSRTLNLTGLNVGQRYYFLVDGCCGSSCPTVSIQVLSPPCIPTVEEFVSPIVAPTKACVGETINFTSGIAPGANTYLWYVDGVYQDFDRTPPIISYAHTFTTAGTYQVCVTAYNAPCIPEDEADREQCHTIEIVEAESGTPMATPTPVCPGGTVNLSATGFVNDPYFRQRLVVVNSMGIIVAVINGDMGTFTFPNCGQFTLYSLSFSTQYTPAPNLTIGQPWSNVNCAGTCCDVSSVPFEFAEASPITFVDPPPDITVECIDDVDPIGPLSWSSVCSGSGTSPGVQTQNYTLCAGGTITRTWTATDGCGQTYTHTQVITIEALPPAVYIDPPANITINCSELAGLTHPSVNYTNNRGGMCSIMGSRNPVTTGTATVCAGGVLTNTWTYTDVCMRTLEHSRTITVIPAALPVFINPPVDVSIACHELQTFTPPSLTVNNMDMGACLITGVSVPQISGTATVCGGTNTVTWQYTDFCMRQITHTQNVTVTPAAAPTFNNPPGNITISCDDLDDLTPVPLTYSNNGLGNCLFSGSVMPTEDNQATVCGGNVTFTWSHTDQCGNNIQHVQLVTVTPITAPVFINPPMNITISCHELATLPPTPSLSYSNGGTNECLTSGSVPGVQSGSATVCGGTLTQTWQFTDQCNNAINHQRTITVTPITPPDFVNPPGDQTIACHELATLPPPPSLAYTNNGTASCLTSGNATPTVSGSATVCGGAITHTWQFTDQCNNSISHQRTITVTPIAPPAFVNPPGDQTIACHELANLPAAPTLGYTNNGTASCLTSGDATPTVSGSATVCGGAITQTWQFTDQCNNSISHQRTITVTPIAPPAFVNPPGDQTIACHELANLPAAPTLAYTNNGTASCLTSGNATPTVSGSATVCGGAITQTWQFTDQCNNSISHQRTITVTPIAPPAFVNPPGDQTIACHELANLPAAPTLGYTNNGTASCLTSGDATPTVSGSATVCGGAITQTWQFTDQCNNSISHQRTITVTPITAPVFINPPGDITIACNAATSYNPLSLSYNNMGTGTCLTTGVVSPVLQNDPPDICGGVSTYTWTFTDQCNNTINHTQNVQVTPMAAPVFVNPPQNITVNCDAIPSGPGDLQYQNNDTGSCSLSGSVPGTVSGGANACGGVITYTWTYTDPCNNTITHQQNITVNPAALPVFVNPPADITVACNQIPTIAPNLEYNNNGSGSCSVQGFVPGAISGSANECGGLLMITWNYTDPCGNSISHVQNITVTPAPPPVFTTLPQDITVTCANVPGIPPPLNYTNNSVCPISGSVSPTQTGNFNACGGLIQYTWNVTTTCGVVLNHVQNVNILPAQSAQWINPPGNITVSCTDANPNPTTLSYSNNEFGACAITGSVQSTVFSNYTACGGTINKTWTFTDICGRTINHAQTITVLPSNPPAFTNPPQNITVSCGNIPTSLFLNYSNNASGTCSITGSVLSVESGNYGLCGGTMFNSWTYTDQCNRTISHQRQITVLPADDPEFFNPPADVTLACEEGIPSPFPLSYGNGGTGFCNLFGQVTPTVQVNGNVTSYTWTFVHPCNGSVLEHVRNITSPTEPQLVLEPDFDNACQGQGYQLSNINAIDFSGGNSTFTYYWNMPFEPGNEIIDPVIFPTAPTEIYVVATNEFGCTDFALFLIEITPSPRAGTGRNDTICSGTNVNLFSFLTGPYDNGSWRRISGPVVNLSNPMNVNLGTAGNYRFEYRVLGTPPCLDAVATVNLLVRPRPVVELIQRACTADKTAYDLIVRAVNLVVTSSLGTVVTNPDSTVTILGVPIGDNVFVSVTDTLTGCFNSLEVTPPNCDCPQIAPPSNPNNPSVCFGQTIPSLSVVVNPTFSVNWFSAASGGTLLQSNSNQYLPSDTAPGTYTYYAEAYLISDPSCISTGRTPVTLTIYELPTAQNAMLETCDDNSDGFAVFNLLQAVPQVNGAINVTVSFHLSFFDAQSGNNPLNNNFTNTIPGVQTIFASVVSNEGCRRVSEVRLFVNPQPVVNVSVTGEVCENQNNGSVTISTSSTGGIYEYRINGTPYSNQTIYTPLQPGTYTAFVRDNLGCIGQRPFVVEEGLSLMVNNFSAICNDNGTKTNVNDDIYNISWTIVNNKNNTGTYRVIENGTEIGTFSYNQLVSIIRNASGQVLNFVFEDVVNGCRTTVGSNPLTPCSTECEVVVNQISESCNNNNTPTNPNDDTYTLSFLVDKVNNPASNTFNVFVNGAFTGNFTYGNLHNISILADGSSPVITFRDGINLLCETSVQIGPLVHCSNECAIEITQISKVCNNNNTKTDATDDFYTITVNAQPVNAPGPSNRFRVFVDNVEVGVFDYSIGGSFVLPANGLDKTIEIRDFDNPTCTDSGTTGNLISCSTDCQITIGNLIYSCDNNGTSSDNSDDFYRIEFLVTAVNGAPNGRFEVRLNNVLNGSYAYGFNHVITVPADGTVYNITFTDSADPSCFESRTLPAFTSCSGACVINAVVTNITCNNNNTPTNPGDDRFTFDLTVTGTNTSGGYTFLLNNSTGSYGVTRTVGPFAISGGTINSFVADIGNPSCLTTVQVVPPPACSDGCELTVSNFQKTGCNNNGTNDNNNDDFYSVSFRVNTLFAGATQFRVRYNNTDFGPFNYGQNVVLNNVPANGIEYNFVITDISASQCMTSFMAQEFPCSECAQVITVSINPSVLDCNNNVATLTATSSQPGIFNWTGPNNYNQFGLVVQASFPGWYYFKATYPDMCERIDSVQLFTDANLPQAIGGPDQAITCLVKEVTLTGSSNLPDNQARYVWYDNAGNVVSNSRVLLVTVPGTYFLEVEDITNSCKSGRDAVLVDDRTDEPSAVIFANPGNILDCVIGSIVLSGQPQTNVIFNWTLGEIFLYNQNSVTVTQPGVVFMIALDTITGCDSEGQILIEDFEDYPLLQIAPVAPITCSTNSTIIDASGSPQGQNLIFTWFNANNQVISGQTGSTLVVSSPGTYYVMLRDTSNGCQNIDTIIVGRIGDFPDITLTDDVSLFCGPTQTTLQVQVNNPLSATSISWTTVQGTILGSAGANSIIAEGSGVYVVEVTYLNSGCTTFDSVNVLVNTAVPESVNASVTDETCVNERNGTIQNLVIAGGTPPYQVRLNNINYGAVTSVSSLAPGQYTLRITDANGCTKDTTIIIGSGVDVQAALEPVIELVAGETSTLEVLLNVDPATITSVQWSPADNLSCSTCLVTELTAIQEGVYRVTVIDENGCEATASIRLIIKDNIVINVPNIIKAGTLNGNNRFYISANEQVLNIQALKVYDRWGELVFSNENFRPNEPDQGWDGTFRSKVVEQGVYVYYIEYVTRNGVQKLVGDLTVLE